MRILMLHVATDLYGSSKILYLVAKKLRREGHHVHLVVSEEGPLLKLFQEIGADTSIIRLGVLRKRYLNVTGLLNRILVLTRAFFALRKLIKRDQIDLIYSNTTPVVIGGLLSKATGIPNVWHLHEIMDPAGSFLHRVFSFIIRSTSKKAIAVSDAVYENWLPFLGSNHLERIYNGIPVQNTDQVHSTIRTSLNISENHLLIGMIGRLNLHKGQFYFLEIAKELLHKHSHLHFVIVGDAFAGYEYLYKKLTDTIQSHGLQDSVHYLGYRTDIPQIMKGLDLFVLPSIKPDPFPTVVLEAMSLGIPVVATAQGGALEQVVDGITGVHIPIDNPKLAAEKMTPLLLDAQFLRTCGQNGKKRLEDYYTLDVFEKNIVQLLSSIH